MKPFNKYFDHTLLKADATSDSIIKLLQEAADCDFASVCVNGCQVQTAASFLASTEVKVATVVGFPLGAMSSEAKLFETVQALKDGADEIDMVINIGAAKDGNWDYVRDEIDMVAQLCHEGNAILKVIIETCLLDNDEIVKACQAAKDASADFVKTSTGFSTGGATLEDVKLMRDTVGNALEIKASGGIRTLEDALAFIDAGADRLGCSASMDIFTAYNQEKND